MEDTDFSKGERLLLTVFGLISLTVFAGLVFAPETFWDGFVKIYIWDPIVKDAGASGDAGYSQVNTIVYILTMVAAVIVLQAIFRKWQLPVDDRMVWALIGWVALAPILRVMEDADYFKEGIDVLFISPLIHIHLAVWLVISAFIGHISRKNHISMLSMLLVAYLAFTGMLVLPNVHVHDTGHFWILGGSILGAVMIAVVLHNTWDWDAIPRSMLAFAIGLITMGLGHWMQLARTPWVQDSGLMPRDNEILWPVLVVVVIPLVITWAVWKKGEEDLAQLRLTGHEVGVIPDGMTLDEWESEDRSSHPVELLSNRGILATPMVAGMLFGQLCDGLATMVGIDWFGYSEKHPLSDAVIQFGGSLDVLGEGAWLFFLVKAALVTLIVWMFSQMRVEGRQQHLRVLIVLAVMIVGMAPGLRDIGRLILGV
ncbi:MAG: DUF63 family protein [Candidatus Poseidoniales archaeon]|nr:DUF63 family protein [Candidatus Poseidoniales archaeon]RJV00419.1 MAG: DUF63 family protein [Candidatus Poseidoniales archaeon]|tara:strand:- start:47 stop:1324 length:1278 start_codon:yes stop_codon:yes gene_type:complete